MARFGRYIVPISDTKVDILAIRVILKVSNKRKVGVDMTALLRRIRLTILGKELLQEITEDAWNDGHTHGMTMQMELERKGNKIDGKVYLKKLLELEKNWRQDNNE